MDAPPANPASPRLRVCFATSTGGYDHARVLDGILARALALRGAEVEMLLCDAALPACQMTKMGRASPDTLASRKPLDYCRECHKSGMKEYDKLGFPVQQFSNYISPEAAEESRRIAESVPDADIRHYSKDGLAVGDHAYAGTLRYFASGNLENEPMGEIVLRRYFEAGLRTIHAIRALIEARRYDVIIAHHGIYIPQGMICETARKLGVRVVSYNPAYRKHSFIFSHHQSYHFTMLDEPSDHWQALAMTPKRQQEIAAYLASRRSGANDWIWFHDKPEEDIAPLLRTIGCNPDKPYVALLTSVVWDAQLHYKANAFPSMLDWIKETIALWSKRTDGLQLVIRIHPAEIRGMVISRQKVADELKKTFPQLPRNVFILPPENQASTYALCEKANAVIIYNTKTGVEVAAAGVPVIVAGEAWVRGKGFTTDVENREDYARVLAALPRTEGMSEIEKLRAEQYAYHFFFRRMIPLPFIRPAGTSGFEVKIKNDKELMPGCWPGLDIICNGILNEAPFIYPAETMDMPFPGEIAA